MLSDNFRLHHCRSRQCRPNQLPWTSEWCLVTWGERVRSDLHVSLYSCKVHPAGLQQSSVPSSFLSSLGWTCESCWGGCNWYFKVCCIYINSSHLSLSRQVVASYPGPFVLMCGREKSLAHSIYWRHASGKCPSSIHRANGGQLPWSFEWCLVTCDQVERADQPPHNMVVC